MNSKPFDDCEAFSNIDDFLVRRGCLPASMSKRPVKRVDAYILADDKKWDGIWQTLYNMSAFPSVKVLLDHDHVPEAKADLAEFFPNIEVIRYSGGSIRKAVIFADRYAKKHSFASVICDSDMLSPVLVKVVSPSTGNFLFGHPVCLPKGSLTAQGKVRSAQRFSYHTDGEGPNMTYAFPDTAYQLTLLAANAARLLGFSGFTFPHQHRPHDQHDFSNGLARLRLLTHSLCQGNFRGWFSDAPYSYADVPDSSFAANHEDMELTLMRSQPGQSAVMGFCPAAIKFHVDKSRQSDDAHYESARKLVRGFDQLRLSSRPYTTREDRGRKGWCVRLKPEPVLLGDGKRVHS